MIRAREAKILPKMLVSEMYLTFCEDSFYGF